MTTTVDLDAEIVAWSLAYGVDPELAAAVSWFESYGDPYAVSWAGAFGPMQVIQDTAVLIESLIGLPAAEIMSDPAVNVRAGVWYLAWMLDRYGGDVELALSAYNGGPGHVDECECVYPPTQRYVDKIMAIYNPRPVVPISFRICLGDGGACLDEDAAPSPAAGAVSRPVAPARPPGVPFCVDGACVEEDAALLHPRAPARPSPPTSVL